MTRVPILRTNRLKVLHVVVCPSKKSQTQRAVAEINMLDVFFSKPDV